MVAARYLKEVELEGLVIGMALIGNERLDVPVVDLCLLVRKLFESCKGALEFFIRQLVTKVVQPCLEAMPAGELAKHNLAAGVPADLSRIHDLVCLAHLEDAILMDAGLMTKGIAA